jgi:tripeptide aminopeptidase
VRGADLNQAAQFVREHRELVDRLFERIEKEQEAFLAAGLKGAHSLPKGSVLGCSDSADQADSLVLAAHIDHVFPAGTDLATKADGLLLRGPGVGDNAANVAAVLTLARLLAELDVRPARPVVFCGTVREEGNGNLEGIAEVLEALAGRVWGVIAVDGRTGSVVNRSLAIHRYLLKVSGPGGHSWGHFGTPSAVHEMARIVAALDGIKIPIEPKTSWNVGTIRGGTSVNAIAQDCKAEIDLRSLQTEHLKALEQEFLAIVNREPKAGIRVEAKLIGERPCAALPAESPLLSAATDAAVRLGIEVELAASSTDAALALWQGIPAVSFGTYRGGGGHTPEEYVETDSLTAGLKWLTLTVLAVAGVAE